jgi:hypothetical protein
MARIKERKGKEKRRFAPDFTLLMISLRLCGEISL